MPHLFADISAHGFGHLAQAAPVLNRLAERLPTLRLTLRSALPPAKLKQRIRVPFAHIAAASDFGFAMQDALRIDAAATAAAYRAMHADFPARVAAEAKLFEQLGIDAVFSDVAYLPLAGAARAGLPAAALCSLNWADLFLHFFGHAAWARPIHAEMLAAYNSAPFLRTTPGMPMPALDRVVDVGPIAMAGTERRNELREKLGAGKTVRLVLVGLGGIPIRLPIEQWPASPDTHWLVPADWLPNWLPEAPQFHAIETTDMSFTDLLRSVDAVVTKPGYGTFAEAVRNGTAVLYQRRDAWPEQDCLIAWLHAHARCRAIETEDLLSGNLRQALDACLQSAAAPAPVFDGDATAARHLAGILRQA